MGRRGGSGRTETPVDESRGETAYRVARYQTDYVGRTCLCYSYHNLLRLPRRCFCWASVFLSFPFPLGRILFVQCVVVLVLFSFVCHISGGARHLFFIFCFVLFHYFDIFFVSLSLSFFSLSMHVGYYVAFVCMCRIQFDGMSLHCLLCLLHYSVASLCRGFVTTELVPL